MNGTVQFALTVLQWLPAVTRGLEGAIKAMEWGRERLVEMVEEGRDPTDAEWAELNDRTALLRDALHTD